MSEIKQILSRSLQGATLGPTKDDAQHGIDIYKFLFGNYPNLRIYFKGAENFTPDDVQKSERFERLGTSLLLAIHLLVNTYDDKPVYKAYVRELINRHVERRLDPTLWLIFWSVFTGYLRTKTTVDDKTEQAWQTFGREFSEEALAHLARQGQPH